MEGVEAFAENGSQRNNLDNLYVDLKSPKLIQTIKELKGELQTIKIDSERIMQMDQMLLYKMHNKGKYETDSQTMSYKHKGKKSKYSNSESSSEVNSSSDRGRYTYISDSSGGGSKPRRRKYKPYEEISGEFKKINPPMFNGEVEKGEEAKAWLS